MQAFGVALLNSLDLGMLLFIIAGGLSIIFGVLGILNFAHGAFYMLGAYVAYTTAGRLELPFLATLLIVPLAIGLMAVELERTVIHRVYDRHVTFQLLLTFALMLVLNELVRLIWGTSYKVVDPPLWLRGSVQVLGARYPVYNLLIIVTGAALALVLWALFTRTLLGKRVRAAALDRETASALGINVRSIYTLVFAFGTWMAAFGGVLVAPVRAITPAMGDAIIIDSFIVVVIGGLGSFPGAVLGALILGAIHGLGGRYLPGTEMYLPYVAMAAVLIFKPHGLLGNEPR